MQIISIEKCELPFSKLLLKQNLNTTEDYFKIEVLTLRPYGFKDSLLVVN